MDNRRRMMLASLEKKREYIFQEGVGLVQGTYYTPKESTSRGCSVQAAYIKCTGYAYSTVPIG